MDIEKVKELQKIIEIEKGKVHFFAIFERERRQGHWDVLLSADGLIPDTLESVGYVIDKLRPLVGGDKGMLEIAKVVLFDKDEHFVNEVRKFLAMENTNLIKHETIGDVSIKRGYILKSPLSRTRSTSHARHSI